MLTAHPSPLELRIFHALNFDGGPFLDGLARALSSHAFGFVVAAVLLVLGLRRWRAAFVAGFAVTLALADFVGSHVLRPLIGRQRPCYALPPSAVRWIGAAANVGSMPSLHAANFFAMAVLGASIDRRLAAPAFVIAIAVALSRVYLGVHWPADILAGAAWGAVAGLVGRAVIQAIVAHRPASSARAR